MGTHELVATARGGAHLDGRLEHRPLEVRRASGVGACGPFYPRLAC